MGAPFLAPQMAGLWARLARACHMLRRASRLILTVALFGSLAGCSSGGEHPEALLVFAAASLADAMDEIEEAFETRSGVEVAVSYGASQMLAQQIARGAPADMFISAGESPVEFLSGRGLLEPAVTNLLTNRLVLVVRPEVASDITSMDLLNAPVVERVAIADPELAPAGRYARDSLTRLGLWDGLQRKLVFGPDVRATLAYVESGNADAALVYATDARAGRNIEILDVVPADSYPRIVYPVAVVRREEQGAAAIEFLDYVRSAAARAIFVKHGFEALD